MATTTVSRAEQVRASIEAFNRGDTAGYAAYHAEDVRYIIPFFPEGLFGRDVLEQTTVAMAKAFPDLQWQIVTLLEDKGQVACELHIEGTHEGPLETPAGEVPATGRGVSFDVVLILEFDEKDLITEVREYMDPGAFMAQLGLTDA